jgi:hypothetical protein
VGTSVADFRPDLESVEPLDMAGAPHDLMNARGEALQFITFHNWVGRIRSEYLGAAFEGMIYIFLFEIEPTRADVDEWLWVVVGDLPLAYITCEDAKNPFEALDGYVGAMEQWVDAARQGASVADLIPVNVPATPENAEALSRRLAFIDEHILPRLKRQSNSRSR